MLSQGGFFEETKNRRMFYSTLRTRMISRKINYVNFSEKENRNLLLNQTKPLGDEFETLCEEISIESVPFVLPDSTLSERGKERKVNKVKIYSVLNLNVHPYQIFITLFLALNNQEKFNSKVVFWERKSFSYRRERQTMMKNSI